MGHIMSSDIVHRSVCLSVHLFFVSTPYRCNGWKDFCESLVKCVVQNSDWTQSNEGQGQSSNGNVSCSLYNDFFKKTLYKYKTSLDDVQRKEVVFFLPVLTY